MDSGSRVNGAIECYLDARDEVTELTNNGWYIMLARMFETMPRRGRTRHYFDQSNRIRRDPEKERASQTKRPVPTGFGRCRGPRGCITRLYNCPLQFRFPSRPCSPVAALVRYPMLPSPGEPTTSPAQQPPTTTTPPRLRPALSRTRSMSRTHTMTYISPRYSFSVSRASMSPATTIPASQKSRTRTLTFALSPTAVSWTTRRKRFSKTDSAPNSTASMNSVASSASRTARRSGTRVRNAYASSRHLQYAGETLRRSATQV